MAAFTPEQLQRYSRHFVLPEIGVSGQKNLLASKVLVIGAGALGTTALMYLASAGIGTIGIADYDKIAFGHGSISGAINIPLDNIHSLYQLPPSRKIFVFCQKGEFSKQVIELLRDAGYDAYNLTGGYAKYLMTAE